MTTTLREEIAHALGPGALADREYLVAVHVGSEHLSGMTGEGRPEAQLFRALQHEGTPPARVLVEGASGSGKTSLILRSLAHAGVTEPPLDTLILRCGENPDALASMADFVHYLVTMLRTQKTFRSVDPEALAHAASDTIARTPSHSTQQGTVGGGPAPLGYSFSWEQAIETITTETAPEERRQLLVDQITQAANRSRLLVAVDDTDRFAALRPDGTINEESISNLFRNGIALLVELPIALVVAVHPAYANVPAVREVTERAAFTRVQVPRFANSITPLPLAMVLDRRLAVARLDVRAEEIFDPAALAQLQGIYFEAKRHDVRRVLRLCEKSALHAIGMHAEKIGVVNVQTALEQLVR